MFVSTLTAPALLPFFFAEQTGHPGLFLGGWDDPVLRREARNFENKLGPDRFLEFFAIFDRHDEGARPSDHAVLVIEIEILDIDRRIGWLLHHDRQAVDDDALLQGSVARAGYGGSVVVRPIARNIDDAPQPVIGILFEQLQCEINRTGNRGTRTSTNRCFHDLGGHGIRRFRAVDHSPGNDDLLVARHRPLEISHGHLAARTGPQSLKEVFRDDGLRIALALNGKFVHIHRIGDVDSDNELDVYGWYIVLGVGESRFRARRGNASNVTSDYRAATSTAPDRDTPAHGGPPFLSRAW